MRNSIGIVKEGYIKLFMMLYAFDLGRMLGHFYLGKGPTRAISTKLVKHKSI